MIDDNVFLKEREMRKAAEAQRDELAAQLKAANETIKILRVGYHDAPTIAVFERMAPLDWRTDDETPLGQMLDGIGDEVEP